MTFVEYWADLKLNHPEKYEQRLETNRLRQRTRRQAIYKCSERHELYKAENRRKYKERNVRLVDKTSTT